MGWIAVVFICIVLLFLFLNVSSSRHGEKPASRWVPSPSPKKDYKKAGEGPALSLLYLLSIALEWGIGLDYNSTSQEGEYYEVKGKIQ